MTRAVLDDFERLSRTYGGLDGPRLLRAVLRESSFAEKTALVSSFGTESAVLLDMVATIDRRIPVIFLDTGKLFPETHDYRETITRLLGLCDVRVIHPPPAALARHDPKGNLWHSAPDRCCDLRKTRPLHAALQGFAAWITGRKRYQGGLRRDLPTIEAECSTGRIKLNPLAPWSSEDVDRYRRLRDLPVHPLLAEGYRSVGCQPCTCRVSSAEAPRAGRWCGIDKSECGIHLGAPEHDLRSVGRVRPDVSLYPTGEAVMRGDGAPDSCGA